ncbi:hypothetical protein AB6D15_20520, partial [Vibrio splendidus]
DVTCPSTGKAFLESMHRLETLYKLNSEKHHFEVFELALNEDYCRSIGLKSSETTLESRHFLTIAFSMYSQRQRELFSTDWSWFRWLKLHRDEITAAFSLNYDLLLETALDRLNREYYSLQVNHHGYGIPLVKPHGSVDFEITPNSICYTPKYPLKDIFADLNNTDIIRLEEHELMSPRRQALCIVPKEANKYSSYPWVANANQCFESKLKGSDYCLFIGISYGECDRPEIDKIVDSLPEGCVIVVANLKRDEEFINKISDRPYIIWDNPEGPVDENGAILSLKCLATGKGLRKCFCRSGLPYQYCDCH